MADYNIYIHAIGTGGATNNNPTVPWAAREGNEAQSPTASQDGLGLWGNSKTIMKAIGIAQNPDSIVATAINAAKKVIPVVAVAFAVTHLINSTIDTAQDFNVIQSGDYRDQIAWTNFKKQISNVFNPISGTINSYKTQLQWNLENGKRQQQRALFGDSVLNSYTNRGV